MFLFFFIFLKSGGKNLILQLKSSYNLYQCLLNICIYIFKRSKFYHNTNSIISFYSHTAAPQKTHVLSEQRRALAGKFRGKKVATGNRLKFEQVRSRWFLENWIFSVLAHPPNVFHFHSRWCDLIRHRELLPACYLPLIYLISLQYRACGTIRLKQNSSVFSLDS